MITFKELLGNNLISDVDIAIQHNLEELLKVMNLIREKYNKPMIITSGLRNKQDHIRIYSQIASKKGEDFDISKVPMKSNHLYGLACDISCKNNDLQKWCLDNVDFLAEIGVWMEDFSVTPTWVHFQIVPPKSGKRFFMP